MEKRMERDIVQSLWIGDRLSSMEQLCIRSFLDHGHPFHLYTYQEVRNVPEGAEVKRAADLLPPEEIFVYRRGYGKKNPSAFSNLFRYTMLLERGGWWTDLDAICLRPLEFPDDHVVGHEREPDGSLKVAIGLVKAPPGSAVVSYCTGYCRGVNKSEVRWGQIGPRLFAEAMGAVKLPVRVLPPDAFYPIDYWKVDALVRPQSIPEGCYSVHLWNSRWRHERMDPDGSYDPESLYERLKRAHRIVSPARRPRLDGPETARPTGLFRGAIRRLRAVLAGSKP
jgi:hypothetical protein